MTLTDTTAYRQVIGSLMKNPLLLLEYQDLYAADFDNKVARICFLTIDTLIKKGALKLTPYEVDQEIEKHENSAAIYKSNKGLDFLLNSYEFAEPVNFPIYYERVKKYSLLRRLKAEKYDISEFYVDEKDTDIISATQVQAHFDDSSVEDILNSIEKKYSVIRSEYLNGKKDNHDPAAGIFELIQDLEKSPSVGVTLEGEIFNTVCRGARQGCFYLKSASTSAGKAIPNYTMLPMENGTFLRADHVKIGDKLIGDDGKPTNVIGIYPQERLKEIYKVYFEDGRMAECCGEHLWQYYYGVARYRRERTESLKVLYERTKVLGFKNKKYFRYRVPLVKPIEYEEKNLAADPYVVGFLINSRNKKYNQRNQTIEIYDCEQDLIDELAKHVPADYNMEYEIKTKSGGTVYLKVNEDNRHLIHLLHPDYLPMNYQISSIAQRRNLIAGLLDSDMYIDKNGYVCVDIKDKNVSEAIVRIMRGLGYWCKLSRRCRTDKAGEKNFYYTIAAKMYFADASDYPVHIVSKEKLIQKNLRKINKNGENAIDELAIVDIEKTPISTEMTCFTVDNPSHLFLMNDYIVTHNTRTSVFDACNVCYPMKWSHEYNDFIQICDENGKIRKPRKVLFIVTEMDKEELQTIMLAYLSGVDEDHILTGKYLAGERARVNFAAQIMSIYSGYFIVEEISEPNLENVQSIIKKYAVVDHVKYVFYDYIHSTASMINEFSRNNLREDVILMMFSNQLKQLAKDYNIFIFSATQVNALGMEDDGKFRNESCIRGAKSVADKTDCGVCMTRVSEKMWNSILPVVRGAIRDHTIPDVVLLADERPTHVIDVYKMRRGRYKNIRIWSKIHLGTGERKDYFMTTAENKPINLNLDLFHEPEQIVPNWREMIEEKVFDE